MLQTIRLGAKKYKLVIQQQLLSTSLFEHDSGAAAILFAIVQLHTLSLLRFRTLHSALAILGNDTRNTQQTRAKSHAIRSC